MQVKVNAEDLARVDADVLALPLARLDPKRWRLPPRMAALDRALGGRIAAALATGDFRGKTGESLTLYPAGGAAARRLVLVGLGEEAKADTEAVRRAAGAAVGAAMSRRAEQLAVAVPSLRRVRGAVAARAIAEGAVLAGYRFDAFREAGEDGPHPLRGVAIVLEDAAAARAARRTVQAGVTLAECVNVARDLSNQPGNELPPAVLASEAQRVAKEVGLRCRVLGPDELRARKMNAILAVGMGSAHPPRLIVLEHGARAARGRRAGARRPTICLVGKGITFDSGGISIKPAQGMGEMKHDMSGAAAVIGTLRAAALLQLPLHVVGVIGAAENMPSGTAYRPGDVVRAMSGKTIEVVNTDAEGRVVLADALHFARSEYEPDAMIDLATLTGACVVALGHWCSGLLGNDESLVERVRRAGEATAERVWPLPLWDEHKQHVKSRVADLKNSAGREAGAITAGAFLAHFAEGTPWAHLDIAGTGWTDKASACQPIGATGVGVRLLVHLLDGWRRG
jgi:leucyl aminopeptidase